MNIKGTRANQMLWDWEEGGKADHNRRAVSRVAISLAKIIVG
jgi:hypothetical protein